jgi:arabinofuranosyltransferase
MQEPRPWAVYSTALSLLAVWTTLLVWHAWVTDDAFITLRTVDNALNGYGLRWNVSERVQVYTHPLWMFLTIAATWFAGSAYHGVLALGIACSLAAVAIVVLRMARDRFTAVGAVLIASTSVAFLDYSTSGLENPLTHLLLAVFVLRWLQGEAGPRKTFQLALIASAVMLNRLDAGLLVLPALGVAAYHRPFRPHMVAAALGMLPLAAWELFSLVYYGFLFPNTAYAKLSTGISSLALLQQGIFYFLDSLRADTITLLTIAGALALTARRSTRSLWPLSFGLVLYLLYILRIGGDFMAGRFFAAPLFLSIILLSLVPLTIRWPAGIAILAAIVALRAGLALGGIETERPHGITDQRRLYEKGTRWILQDEYPLEERFGARRGREWRSQQRRVTEAGAVGMTGFFAGPGVHIIDRFALTDPLLARRPANPGSRIGHFERRLPAGYVATVRTGRNQLQSRRLAEFYDDLVLITQGPLWTRERWAAIFRLNVIQRTV